MTNTHKRDLYMDSRWLLTLKGTLASSLTAFTTLCAQTNQCGSIYHVIGLTSVTGHYLEDAVDFLSKVQFIERCTFLWCL